MTIQELARRANVTPRTIRYYVEQGILPPPERGRPAEYTEDHLRRLELVRRLKEQYLPLNEIRDTMQRLSLDEVERLLATSAEYSPPPESGALSSAADYIASVLARSAIREEMKRQTLYAPPPASPGMPAVTAPASTRPAPVPAAPPPESEAFSIAFQAPQEAGPAPSQSPGPIRSTAAGTWHRVLLAPGIELHYVATDNAAFNQKVARLIQAAAKAMEETPEQNQRGILS